MTYSRRELRTLTQQDLIKEARRADAALGAELDRVWKENEGFRAATDYALTVEDEQNRRKKGR